MTTTEKLNAILEQVPFVNWDAEVEDYSVEDYRRTIQDIQATIECEGSQQIWIDQLENAVHYGYEKLINA